MVIRVRINTLLHHNNGLSSIELLKSQTGTKSEYFYVYGTSEK